MSDNKSRRDVLKKIAATGVVGSGLIASTGTAAAADSSYVIDAELDSGSSTGEYQVYLPYGDDMSFSVQAKSNVEGNDGDGIHDNPDRGGVEVYGVLDESESDTIDSWDIDSMGDPVVDYAKGCTVSKRL